VAHTTRWGNYVPKIHAESAGHYARSIAGVMAFSLGAFSLLALPASGAPEPPERVEVPQLVARTTLELPEIQGETWAGAPGITETVDEIMTREARAPKVPAGTLIERPEPRYPDRRGLPDNPAAPAVSRWPPRAGVGTSLVPYSPQSVGPANFLAVDLSMSGFIPPDSMGAVGPSQILAIANGRIRVFSKGGVLGGLDTSTDLFFASVRSDATSDPHIRYDRLTQRWFVVMIDVAPSSNRVLFAVSSGPTITGTASFTFYQFQMDAVGATPNSDTGGFADYPTLGVDRNALYVGVNVFDSSGNVFISTTVFVVNKASLLAGTLTVAAFRQIGTAGGSGPGIYTPQGVDNDDPVSTEGYFVGVDGQAYSTLDIRRVISPGGVPSLSANMALTVPTTRSPLNVPYSGGTGNSLDAIDDRLFAAAVHRNKVAGTNSLWTAHNIQVNSSGVGSSSGGRDGSRWYEIANMISTPTLVQSGTLYDASGTPLYYWMPSVAASGQGHMALGCSRANLTTSAGVAVAGRLRPDAAGTTQAPTVAQAGSGSYTLGKTLPRRWGDFSQTVVDPTDDQTMWTFQEYVSTNNVWAVRAVQLQAPAPTVPASCSPASVSPGSTNVNVVVTGTSTSGTEFFDPGPDTGGPGFPNHLGASVGGTGVTVNSVTFTDPTHFTMNITVAAGATSGSRSVTVTNPDGQTAVSVTGILTIGGTCPAITGTVTGGGTICSGGASTVTVTVTVSGGMLPYTVTLTNGGGTKTGTGPAFGFPVSPGSTTSYGVQSLTDAAGCAGSSSGTATVVVNPSPATPVITAPTGVAPGATGQVASAAAHAGSSYFWSITNGSITAGQNTNQIMFTAGISVGTLTLTVVETSGGCQSAASTASVAVTLPGAPEVTGVVPRVGPVSGGTPVTLTGTGFQPGATISIGGAAAGSVVFVSSTSLTATTPPRPVGPADVAVTNPGGATSLVLPGGFLYTTLGVTPRFYTIVPCRILDTRNPNGPFGGPPLAAGSLRSLVIPSGSCPVPADAVGVVLNVTIADATDPGTLTIFPGSGSIPGTNTISFVPGKNRANNVVLGLVGGVMTVKNFQSTGSINLIVDVNGYFK
jgi:hypothetical protein